MKRLFAILILLGLIAAGVFGWANAAWEQPGPATPDGKPRIILIPPGTRAHAAASMLHDIGALNHPLIFEFDLRWRRLAPKLKAGEYAIPSKASMADIAAIMIEGRSIEHRLTAAEGLTSDMIHKIVAADPVLRPMYPEEDLGPAKERLVLFLEQYWGGPTTYSQQRGHPRLRMRHNPFKVNPDARDRWLAHMRVAVDGLGLAPLQEETLWNYMERAAFAMVNTFEE